MKRIDVKTNKPFKQGTVRDDGCVFWGYNKSVTKKSGYFKENWVIKQVFDTKRDRNKLFIAQDRLKNPKKYVEGAAKWQKLNKDKVCAASAKRKSAKLQRTPKWISNSQIEEIKQFYIMAKELEKVFPWKQHVDHIEPLQGKQVCGLHVPWNLQILSEFQNKKKGIR